MRTNELIVVCVMAMIANTYWDYKDAAKLSTETPICVSIFLT